MKKFLFVVLIMTITVCLIGCGSNIPTDNYLEEVSLPALTEIEIEDIPIDTSTNISEEVETVEQTNESNIAESIIYNENDITITAKSLSYDDYDVNLDLLIENNSNENITVQTRLASINDIMVDPSFSCDVVSGKKVNDSISFSNDELSAYKIDSIKTIEFYFTIFNADTWDDIADSSIICLQTDAINYTQTIDDSGFTAVDADGFKIVTKDIAYDDLFENYNLNLYIQNNTTNNVTIQVRDVSVNGFMIDPSFSCDVAANKMAYNDISFSEEDLVENGISEIKEIELYFTIFDTACWDDIKDTETIKIQF